MDRTSAKQWLHDISHVGMRMGQSCPSEQRNQGTRRKLFITEPSRVYHLLSDDGFEVSDLHHVNDDCLYVSYNKSKEDTLI